MVHVRQRLGVSERGACRVLGQARSTQRRRSTRKADEEALREDVVRVARSLPDGDGASEDGGLGGEPQACGADLEGRGVEGTEEAAQTGTSVVGRRLLYPAPALVPAPGSVTKIV